MDEGMEVVYIDNGSTDHSVDIVRDFTNDLPVRVMTPSRFGNWVAATNFGLSEARGEWACFLHNDDLWLPGRIARLRHEMELAEGSLVLHNAVFIGPDGSRLGPWTCPLPEGIVPPYQFIERLLVQNFIAAPSPMFRRDAAIRSGGLDEELWFSADWDFWLRLGAMGPVRFVAETLSAFRVHPASQTAARKLQPGEWEHQLSTVFNRHFAAWVAPERRKRRVECAAKASIGVNSLLSAASRGEKISPLPVLLKLLGLGPLGWRRYLRDSRIVERVWSRLKVQELRRH
jgi:Glycosyl transferase family 2